MSAAIVDNNPRYKPDPEASASDSLTLLWHLDGVPWLQAPPPEWHHHCWAQTVGLLNGVEEVWRCPCGTRGGPLDPWVQLDCPRYRASFLVRCLRAGLGATAAL